MLQIKSTSNKIGCCQNDNSVLRFLLHCTYIVTVAILSKYLAKYYLEIKGTLQEIWLKRYAITNCMKYRLFCLKYINYK